MSNLLIDLIPPPIFEWYVVMCGSNNGYHTSMCVNKDWIACLQYDNHSRFNKQCNGGGGGGGREGGGPIWPFNEHESLCFRMNKVSIQGPKL